MENIKSLITLGALIGFLKILQLTPLLIIILVNKIKRNKDEEFNIKFNKYSIFWGICIVCAIINIIPNTYLGSTQINSIIEKNQYKEKYYVYMYPEGNENKYYKLKADIYSQVSIYDEYSEREYFIEKAYFPNGGYITFNNSFDFNSLKVEEKSSIHDDEGKYWEIVLTKDKVKNNDY